MTTYQRLLDARAKRGAGYFVLIDPDNTDIVRLPAFVDAAVDAGVDGFLIGGSLMLRDQFETVIQRTKERTSLPVAIFPGSLFQISAAADAILFLVLISGRNPDHLIGNHVVASPMIKAIGLEAISTAYMLVEGGATTSAEFMSNTRPLPRNKPDIAVAHALAAEFMGMKFLYFDAGSGADQPVSNDIVRSVAQHSSVPIIVGGGIRTPEEARKKVEAGAAFVVTGNVFEEKRNHALMKEFAEAVHKKC